MGLWYTFEGMDCYPHVVYACVYRCYGYAPSGECDVKEESIKNYYYWAHDPSRP